MPKKPLINYTSLDFESIKSDLIEHAKRYYPNRYNDFNQSSFGSMIFDSVAYVGDMLSYYLDFQVNENFMETAIEYENVRKMASQMGYSFLGRPSTYGMIDIYVLIPATTTSLGPIIDLFPIVRKGSTFANSGGAIFTLTEDIDFNDPNVEIVAARFNDDTGRATHYALRASGQVKSGNSYYKEIDVGPYEKFRRVRIGPNSINEIVSVYDSQGNEYYQVDHLSQEVIYIETTNPNVINDQVKSILKPFSAARRFVVEQDTTGTYLRFGFGSETELDNYGIIEPSNVVLKMSGKNYITDNAFDPNRLMGTEKFGVVPTNTRLRVTFGSNNIENVDTSRGFLNQIRTIDVDFPGDPSKTYEFSYGEIIDTMECSNTDPIEYQATLPSTDEIKYRAYAKFSSQNRIVTKHDYEAYCYQMPPVFGSIKRVSVFNDPSGTNRRVCLYVVSENTNGFLTETNQTTKNNLKTWLNKNKLMTDLIDVKDTKIINVGFDYTFVVDSRRDKLEVLSRVQRNLIDKFSEKLYVGEPIYITEIYNTINKTRGVVDALKVTPKVLNSDIYSQLSIHIDDIMSKDGTFIQTPNNCILEIKYPEEDIRGTIL